MTAGRAATDADPLRRSARAAPDATAPPACTAPCALTCYRMSDARLPGAGRLGLRATSQPRSTPPIACAPIPLEILERPVTLRTRHRRARTTPRPRHRRTRRRSTTRDSPTCTRYVWIEAARSFNAALGSIRSWRWRTSGLSVAYVELNRPAEARAGDRRRAGAGAHRCPITIAVMSTRARCRWRPRTRRATRHGSPRIARRSTPRSRPSRRTSSSCCCAASPSRPIPPSADRAARPRRCKYYERALALVPGHFAAHHYLTHADENTGQHEAGARRTARRLPKSAPEVPHARHMHGHNLRRAGRVFEAIAEFEAADRLHREYTQAREDSARIRLALRAQPRPAGRRRCSTPGR